MLKKKICMLGGFGVGKSSLVKHFVHSIFSEKYHITIGVKIDKKSITIGDQEVLLLLWDIAGEEEKFSIPPSYLKGSDGYLLIVDVTRKSTLEQAFDIQKRTMEAIGDIPFVIMLNKSDLKDERQLETNDLDEIKKKGWLVIESSAKLGTGVEEAFNKLVSKILPKT
ncbi:MAG: GTP-binding protein [Candidatus Marinimicrobia bacterium]|nr:GTP-binding protein [Candidatus Neomarinimicrobiota bacterium]